MLFNRMGRRKISLFYKKKANPEEFLLFCIEQKYIYIVFTILKAVAYRFSIVFLFSSAATCVTHLTDHFSFLKKSVPPLYPLCKGL